MTGQLTPFLCSRPESKPVCWIGSVNNSDVVCMTEVFPLDEIELHCHKGSGSRWRYRQDSGKIYWWNTPTRDEQIAVENFLAKKSLQVQGHEDMTYAWQGH